MKTNRIFFETILVIAVTLFGMWFVPAAKTLFALIPIVYLLIERASANGRGTISASRFGPLGLTCAPIGFCSR